ncbi:YfhO family protein [Delftia sp. CH05]|uniref:YfhO family protein n=1 Tax=Delftia sp. CH05 TaxID=2692194 RepID=UPI00135D9FC4|nr:YfhO family protein [Delftia sp. CH05]MXN27653.1 hypothetical protein [Delftia sp. CH05]
MMKYFDKINSNRCLLIIYILFLFLIGTLYSGRLFLEHMADGISAGSVGSGLAYMVPGDHHEQFYRYSLFYENLLRGRFPYYTGYQYASHNFTEGLIFFPFTAIVGGLTFFFGPILAYNILVILSYPMVGIAGYLMVNILTKNRVAAIVAGTFLALIPFRTSFLYGQMVYGVDAILLPLLIYFFERARLNNSGKSFFVVGLISFFLITANFQLFYWAAFILWPYFLYGTISIFLKNGGASFKKISWIFPGLLCTIIYGLFILSFMKSGVLDNGQKFDETFFYTPEISRLFHRFSGNEKNVYFGVSAIFVLFWFVSPIFRINKQLERSALISIFSFLFLLGFFLIFGPKFDQALQVPIYRWFFENFPGFNGTRTPGRIMSVVSVIYAILLGFCIAQMTSWFSNRGIPKLSPMLGAVACLVIVWDFYYLSPRVNIFTFENSAYQSIKGSRSKVITLPFQYQSDHYLNSTFLPFALKYDIRLFSGHSSFYPKAVDAQVARIFSLNDGVLSREQWQWIKENDYKYIIAHNTSFQPAVDDIVISALDTSPYLEKTNDDQGVVIYKIREDVELKKDDGFDISAWHSRITEKVNSGNLKIDTLKYAFGWHSREAYPNQKPFRWINGLRAFVVLPIPKKDQGYFEFEYICPHGNQLGLNLLFGKAKILDNPMADNWRKVQVSIGRASDFAVLEMHVDHVFKAPPDIRDLGCQVGDVKVQ